MIEFDELLLALNELQNIVVVTDIDGNVRYVNDAFETQYGYTKEEVLGKSTSILASGYHNKVFYKNMWNTILNGETWEGTILNKNKNGRLIWEEAKISPIKKNGRVNGFIAIKEDISYKKELEEQYQQEKILLDVLFDNAPFSIIVFDSNIEDGEIGELQVVKANPIAGELFRKLGLVGLRLHQFFPEFNRGSQHTLGMLQSKQIFESFFESLDKHLKIITFPLDKDRFCMFIHDVTNYRNNIKALEESEERYAKLVEDAPAFIRRFDKDGNISYANAYYAKYIGVQEGELIGQNIFKIVRDDEKEALIRNVNKLTPIEPIIEYKQHKVSEDNKEIWHKWIDRALFDSFGNVIEYQSVGMDFTNLFLAEKTLEEQKDRLDAIFDNSLMGIAVIDAMGNFKSANNRLVDMLEAASYKSILSHNYFDFAIDKTDSEVISNFAGIFNGDLSYFNVQRKYQTLTGKEFWGDLYASPIKIEGGHVTEVVGMIVDITQRKSAEEELKANEEKLRHLNATKDKLFSVIAHDIRNPFNAILGYANMLKSGIDNLNKQEVKGFAHKIADASEQTFKLLEDLLTWAKSQLGQLKVKKEKFKPALIIQECMDTLNALAHSKEIKLEQSIPVDLEIESDLAMFKFAVRNLIHNGIKFSNQQSKVICTYEFNDNNTISFLIQDFGVGIKPEKLANLFDLNASISSKGTAQEKGTGLGLSMSKEMVELNNGELKVTSQENQGSTFKIILPLKINA